MQPPQKRTFGIRAAATLTLFAATTGCADKDSDDDEDGGGGSSSASIVGTWGLDTVSYGGDTSDFPYYYSGDGYSYLFGIQMRIDSRSGGDWCTYYSYTYNGEQYDYEECYYAVSINSVGGAQYEIQVDMGLTMTCDLGTASLSCTGEDDMGTYDVIDWFRVD